jgi:DNA-binding CsgD family transcriptional regulator
LETLREYGALRAAEVGELDELRVRHRGHYLGLAQQAAGSWATGQQGAWFRRLSDEHANLRQALDDSTGTPEAAVVGLETAARLWLWWQAAGRLGEGRRWVVRLLEAAPSDSPSRALGLWAAGYLALVQRDVEVGERTLEHALAAARAAQDEEAESYAIGHLGLARLFAGSFEEARSLLHESVRRHRGGGRPGIAAFQLADAALAATFGGDTETALREFAASLAEARTLGDRWTQSHALWGLGIARWMRRETDQVDEAMREALASMREVRDPTGVALCLEGLALAAAARRDAERAAWLWGAAATAWEAIPVRPPDIVTAFREPSLAAVREALGSRRFQAHFDAGRATDVEDATALALGEPAALAAHDARREPPKLTRREQQVALLVADGLSNRDIGERLVLSPRTIESHVERIMNRLGVGSRAEIAAWAARELDGSERVEIP